MIERIFTPDQARALLPELRERLAAIKVAREGVVTGTRRVEEKVAADGGGVADPELFASSRELRRQVEALNALGVVLRDASTGLVDFPCEMNGEPAFLCWRSDEDDVGHWHGVDAGFSARRPL